MELKLGSIPLRIRGSFFLMALFLGFNEENPARLGIWVAVVLVSVIVHELGHALVGKAFGFQPSIELQGMGGLTTFTGGRAEASTAKSIAISVAGPFAGFLLAVLLFAIRFAGFRPGHPLAAHALSLLWVVNLAWGVFNLLPMLPLDGGNVLRTTARAITKEHGDKIARVISVVVAVGIAVLAVSKKQWWVLYLGVLFAFQNVQALRQDSQLRTDQRLAQIIEQAHAALGRREFAQAIALLKPALAADASADVRQVGLRVYVVALIEEAAWTEAMSVIERERSVIGAEDLARWSQAMRQLGRPAEADRIDELVKAPAPLSEFRA